MLIGLCGKIGSGKDTIAKMIAPRHVVRLNGALVEVRSTSDPWTPLRGRGVQVAMADKMKAFCHEVYDFSREALWGASKFRNAPDHRYPRAQRHDWTFEPVYNQYECKRCGERTASVTADHDGDPCLDYLTPREALQQLGTEWGRRMYEGTWVVSTLRFAGELLKGPQVTKPRDAHTFRPNWVLELIDTVVISDVRFVNEAEAIRAVGGQVWRLHRGLEDDGAEGHASEREQSSDAMTALVSREIQNTGSLESLYEQVKAALA